MKKINSKEKETSSVTSPMRITLVAKRSKYMLPGCTLPVWLQPDFVACHTPPTPPFHICLCCLIKAKNAPEKSTRVTNLYWHLEQEALHALVSSSTKSLKAAEPFICLELDNTDEQPRWSLKRSVCTLACVGTPLHPTGLHWVGSKTLARGWKRRGMWDSFRVPQRLV